MYMRPEEPTVSLLTKAGNLVGIKVRGMSPDQLVEDALASFQKAEDKMNNAIAQINDNVKVEQEAIKAAEQRIQQADASKARLTRVIDRLKALTE